MIPDEPQTLYARQPIYDRSLTLAGFELLFRDSAGDNAAPSCFDGNVATSRVLVNAFTQSNLEEICATKPVFVNFTAETLVDEIPFSPDKLVIEVLESVVATPAVIEALVNLRQNNYRIALDDYDCRDAGHPLFEYADIIKLEYPQFSAASLEQTIAALRQANPRLVILAEKIETWNDFEVCSAMGCDLLQGYFIARPEPVYGQPIPASRLNLIQLLATLNDPEASFDETTAVIRNDPFLSLRLLKLVNSAWYRRLREITSLSTAIMALGMTRVRAFASLLVLSKLQNKPHALHQIAATRAFMCQILCDRISAGPDMGFMMGLLSCLEALFDHALADILEQIPFDHKITAALLEYEGALGTVLNAVIQHEQGRFDAIGWADLAELGIGPVQLMDAFERGAYCATQYSSALQ